MSVYLLQTATEAVNEEILTIVLESLFLWIVTPFESVCLSFSPVALPLFPEHLMLTINMPVCPG